MPGTFGGMKKLTGRKFTRWFVPASVLMILAVSAHAGVSLTVTTPSTSTATVLTSSTIKATAPSTHPISSSNIYVDGKGVWSSGAASSISAPLSVTAGTHRVTVIANDSAGASDSSVLALTAVNSSGVNVTISTPTNSATVGTPFTLKASSPSGVNGWYVYSDGVA